VRVRLAIPDRILDASTLDALLEATTRAGQRQIERGEAPDVRAAIKRGLRWRPERFVDGEHFDLPVEANARGWGDCDDLAPWLAASLRASGEDPRAEAVASKSGPTRWHVRVKRGNGEIQDPSAWAGMNHSVSGPAAGVHALAASPLAMPGDGAVALLNDGRRWWSRCDLPWADSHVACVSPGATPDAALENAVTGALDCSDGCSPEHAEYVGALTADLLSESQRGGLLEEVLGVVGDFPPRRAPLRAGGFIDRAPSTALFQLMHGAVPIGHATLPGGAHLAWRPRGPILARF